MKQKIHSLKHLKEKRSELRQSLTPAEAFLWKHLKARQFEGRRFNRQHSIKNYIVDFYCAKEKLIIELDGEVHNNEIAQEKDRKRTKTLEELGYNVIRFENKMVFENLASVFMEIKANFK
ncbi:endonuclease domain-containing protein [Flavivirga rizhaonensis]|uniref:Endonuclease domain-containing protein n=1 Tax=Flavivirga rizhaonensis TaxID=2559571 RepID=A0A4S1DWT4_9FLAO|nr:endonuclease domain-containing protein [Flavivirga rizhaonensis]TGV02661.1 endonuclease domain-containing protein [Flavivirga rizhaonensis]